jgi:mono/diheme cytochrome c family protein
MSKDRWLVSTVLVAIFLLALGFGARTNPVWAQGGGVVLTPSGRVTTGELEFRRYCASCHGRSGKGNGSVAAALKEKLTDLTTLSKNNGGKFPREHVYDAISGAAVVEAHGTREMPIWGLQMRRPQEAVAGAGGTQRSPQQVKAEIDLITDYIESQQVK